MKPDLLDHTSPFAREARVRAARHRETYFSARRCYWCQDRPHAEECQNPECTCLGYLGKEYRGHLEILSPTPEAVSGIAPRSYPETPRHYDRRGGRA